MRTIHASREDEQVVPGHKVSVGQIIATDWESRVPQHLFLVTKMDDDGIIKGVYIGVDSHRSRSECALSGFSQNVIVFPNATLVLHGIKNA